LLFGVVELSGVEEELGLEVLVPVLPVLELPLLELPIDPLMPLIPP